VTETEKKELAEWMGWRIVRVGNENIQWFQNIRAEQKPGKPLPRLDKPKPWRWDPDTNPEQFLEVLEHMTEKEIVTVNGYFIDKGFRLFGIQGTKFFMSHKSEVLKALLQTINQ